MLIELGQLGDASAWADKAMETFPRGPELLAAKAVALDRIGDLNGTRLFFPMRQLRSRPARLMCGWLAATCCWPGEKRARIIALKKALMLAPR